MTLRVHIDEQIFAAQRRGGISRYFTELIREFRADPGLGVEPVLPFRYVVNEHLQELANPGVRPSPLPDVLNRPRVLRALNAATRRRSPGDISLVHHTYYFPAELETGAGARVCTVYDMIPELFPEHFSGGNPHQAKRDFVDACDAVLCISETTRADLLRVYGALDKPVVVTHLGVGGEFFTVDADPDPDAAYILFVGQRGAYKNFAVLLESFAAVAARQPSLDLLCVGGGDFSPAEKSRMAELDLAGRVRHRHVPDAELPGVYARATCFVFPSRYEGFGLPVLEAMAAGCPVVVADTPCLLEVAGTAAAYFPPDDVAALADLLERAAGDPGGGARWRERGRLRAADFSWSRTARQTAEVYRQVGAGRR
jgi:glycosyltransferase involved in cell wall biosynthesis